MAVKKITKRWLFNNLGVILVILLALEVAFAIGVRGFFYSSVEQSVNSQANYITSMLKSYSEDSSVTFSTEVRRMVEQFGEKDKMELMAVDINGNVIITSSGFESTEKMYMPDFEEAIVSSDMRGQFRGVINNENVLAITVLSPVNDESLAAMRFVVSLSRVDEQIVVFIAIITLIGVAIIFFVILSSSYFINSIVIPVGEMGKTARRIAQGDFKARLEKKNDDEIGELCDIINYMAEELATSEALKNDFISSVSHELRTPLTSIKGWVETIAAIRDPADPNFRRGVQVISSEADRLYSMVEELLDFSRMQNGLKLDLQLLDLVAEVSDAAIMVERRVELEGLHLAYDEPEEPMPVMADPARLRQVFINVLDNAVKYSPPHGTVRMDVLSDGNSAFVNISDEGRGIAPDDLENVKVKFFKGKGAVRGSGIGLAVVDEIVTALDGSVDIQSEVGRGTTVTVRLPLYKRPAPSGAPPRGGTAGV
mgnify:CR=1 FL=1